MQPQHCIAQSTGSASQGNGLERLEEKVQLNSIRMNMDLERQAPREPTDDIKNSNSLALGLGWHISGVPTDYINQQHGFKGLGPGRQVPRDPTYYITNSNFWVQRHPTDYINAQHGLGSGS